MKQFDHQKLSHFCLSLPDEVEKYEQCGLFREAEEAIERHLQRPLSADMKDRLELELEVLRRLPVQFPYTAAEAVGLMQESFPGFGPEDLEEMDRQGYADWIWYGGEKHYIHNVARNLLHLQGMPWSVSKEEEIQEKKLLKETDEEIRREGKASWRLRVRASLKIRDEAFRSGETVTVHLPIPAAYAPVSDIRILDHSPNAQIDEESSLFRSICFRETMEENHPFFVEYEYTVTSVYHDFSPEDRKRAETVFSPDPSADQYLCEELPHIRFTPALKSLAAWLKGDETDPVRIAQRIYGYITENVKYSYMRIYSILKDIPDYCARNLRGDCGVQALLFLTLCRICGVPARWQSGLYVHPDYVGAHDWAMFYAAPYGWLPADPSFGGSAYREKDEERRAFYLGSQDPFRMPANNAFMQPYAVQKKWWPIDVSDNQTGEAESEDRGFSSDELEKSQELLSWTKEHL